MSDRSHSSDSLYGDCNGYRERDDILRRNHHLADGSLADVERVHDLLAALLGQVPPAEDRPETVPEVRPRFDDVRLGLEPAPVISTPISSSVLFAMASPNVMTGDISR